MLCVVLGIMPWYATQPDGLDTQLRSGGAGLSSGEAQLLSLSRVFLKDPQVVILDEPTSRLDRGTERLIESALDEVMTGRTVMIIAHHLATVARCDDIMILEDGRIVEHGDRKRLAADPNTRYHHLLQTGMEEVLA